MSFMTFILTHIVLLKLDECHLIDIDSMHDIPSKPCQCVISMTLSVSDTFGDSSQLYDLNSWYSPHIHNYHRPFNLLSTSIFSNNFHFPRFKTLETLTVGAVLFWYSLVWSFVSISHVMLNTGFGWNNKTSNFCCCCCCCYYRCKLIRSKRVSTSFSNDTSSSIENPTIEMNVRRYPSKSFEKCRPNWNKQSKYHFRLLFPGRKWSNQKTECAVRAYSPFFVVVIVVVTAPATNIRHKYQQITRYNDLSYL